MIRAELNCNCGCIAKDFKNSVDYFYCTCGKEYYYNEALEEWQMKTIK